jgi:hypothetical protein
LSSLVRFLFPECDHWPSWQLNHQHNTAIKRYSWRCERDGSSVAESASAIPIPMYGGSGRRCAAGSLGLFLARDNRPPRVSWTCCDQALWAWCCAQSAAAVRTGRRGCSGNGLVVEEDWGIRVSLSHDIEERAVNVWLSCCRECSQCILLCTTWQCCSCPRATCDLPTYRETRR